MRKFTVQSKKEGVFIYELEVEIVTPMQDPSVLWSLRPGEYKASILKPESFLIKQDRSVEGKKEVFYKPDVWCWHSLCDSEVEATHTAAQLVKKEFEFKKRKYGTEYTEADVDAAIEAITFVSLKA